MRLLQLAPYDIGLFTKLDDDDYERVSPWLWHARLINPRYGRFYVERSGSNNSVRYTLYLHRWLTGAPKGMHVDHVNGDSLDNQKSNLRVVTVSQNLGNIHRPPRGAAGFYGVSWHKQASKWMARIKYNYRQIHLGLFSSPIEAALAYDRKARELRGPITHLNFPDRP